MTLKTRLAQLEKQQPAARPTWKDFITGAWEPDSQAWAAFVADLEPSEILTRVDVLLDTARTRKAQGTPRLSVAKSGEAEDLARRINGLREMVNHDKP